MYRNFIFRVNNDVIEEHEKMKGIRNEIDSIIENLKENQAMQE